MAEQRFDTEKALLQVANAVTAQSAVLSSLTQRLDEMEARRIVASGKIDIEVTGTNNQQVIKFVKSIYQRKKYNKGGNIVSINVDKLETTKGGYQKVFITKTLKDGSKKSHPIMNWEAKKQ